MFYRIRITYKTKTGQTITNSMNVEKLPQIDAILKHLQDVMPGTLTVFWTEEETV